MPEVVEGFKATREPLLGSLSSILGVGLALAAPMWVIVLAVVHTEIVHRAAALVVSGDGMVVEKSVDVISGQQVYWELLTSPWLLLTSVIVTTLMVSCVMLLMFFAVGAWRLFARLLGPAGDRRAHARYGALVDGPVELTADAWEHNLPVSSTPLTDAELEAVEVQDPAELSAEE